MHLHLRTILSKGPLCRFREAGSWRLPTGLPASCFAWFLHELLYSCNARVSPADGALSRSVPSLSLHAAALWRKSRNLAWHLSRNLSCVLHAYLASVTRYISSHEDDEGWSYDDEFYGGRWM